MKSGTLVYCTWFAGGPRIVDIADPSAPEEVGYIKTIEWREAARRHQWEDDYLNSAGTLKFMQDEYQHLEALLTELGDAKTLLARGTRELNALLGDTPRTA